MAWNGSSENGQGSQERGPSTFTYNPQAPSQQQVGLGTTQVRAGMVGGNFNGQTIQYDEHSNGTAALTSLLGIAADKLAPVAKKMEESAYLDGMARAAAGQEMTQIINERPWFTRIFGDTPVVEGARAYKAKEATANFQALSTENMNELRKRAPETMSMYAQEQFDKFANTGDPETDRLIKNTIAQAMPDLIRVQTREHVKYQQEVASDNQLKAWGSTAAALQTNFTSGAEFTPEMLAEAKAAYGASLAPPPGADIDSWTKNLMKHVELSAAAGNFHAVRAVEEMGAFAHMKVEDRAKLEPILKRYELQWASEQGMQGIQQEYLIAMHDVAMGRVTPEEIMVWQGKKSDEYRAKTGSSVGLFGLSAQNQMAKSAQSARAQVLAQDYKAAKAAADAGEIQAYVMSRINDSSPTYIAATSRGLVKESEALEMSRDFFNTKDTPGKVQLMVTWAQEKGYQGHRTLESDLSRVIKGANPEAITPDFLQAATVYDMLQKNPGGTAAIGTWFDAKDANLLRTFIRSGGLNGDAMTATKAMQYARMQAELSGVRPLAEKPRKEAAEFVKDKTSRGGFFFDWTKTKANPATGHLLNTYMADEVAQRDGFMSGNALYEESWRAVLKRVQPLGGYIYRVDPTREVADLETTLTKKAGGKVALNSDWVSDAVDKLVADRLKLVGGDADEQVYMTRDTDRNGVAQFTVWTAGEDSLPKFSTFTSDHILDYIHTMDASRLDKINKRATNLDVTLTPGGAALVNRKHNPK